MPGTPRCHTSQLAAAFTGASSAMLHKGVTLVLTNESDRTCYVYGYEGLGFLDSQGNPLPTHLSRTAQAHTAVTLRPGRAAYTSLYWSVYPDSPAGARQSHEVRP
jgi:hypothetical protein